MSWADKKIKEYKNGVRASFIEKRNLEHANPVLFTILVISIALFVKGTWDHNCTVMASGMILGSLGHIYVWTRK